MSFFMNMHQVAGCGGIFSVRNLLETDLFWAPNVNQINGGI